MRGAFEFCARGLGECLRVCLARIPRRTERVCVRLVCVVSVVLFSQMGEQTARTTACRMVYGVHTHSERDPREPGPYYLKQQRANSGQLTAVPVHAGFNIIISDKYAAICELDLERRSTEGVPPLHPRSR